MQYEYTVSSFHFETLDIAIRSALSSYTGMITSGNKLNIMFSSQLSVEQKQQLDNIVSNHEQNFSSSFNYSFLASKNTQQQNIAFGQSLLHDWMRKNTLEGMTIVQSLWIFSRFERFEVEFGFGPKRVDLFKMFQSGAIPTVYFCILQVQPDSMTEPYHWLTQDRLDWVKTRLESHLGEGMVAYIQGLSSQILGE
jgi:hypothetical protein